MKSFSGVSFPSARALNWLKGDCDGAQFQWAGGGAVTQPEETHVHVPQQANHADPYGLVSKDDSYFCWANNQFIFLTMRFLTSVSWLLISTDVKTKMYIQIKHIVSMFSLRINEGEVSSKQMYQLKGPGEGKQMLVHAFLKSAHAVCLSLLWAGSPAAADEITELRSHVSSF